MGAAGCGHVGRDRRMTTSAESAGNNQAGNGADLCSARMSGRDTLRAPHARTSLLGRDLPAIQIRRKPPLWEAGRRMRTGKHASRYSYSQRLMCRPMKKPALGLKLAAVH